MNIKAKVVLGTISCLSTTTRNLEERIKMHKKQLDWLESITEKMTASGHEALPYVRVEQGWSADTEAKLETSLPLHSLKFDKPIPPGSARNELIKFLSQTDADWLVCMDDDHALCDRYNCHEIFWDLDSEAGVKLAKARYLIGGHPAYWEGFKQSVADWGKAETDWWIRKNTRPGYMNIFLIPNLAKYGYEPVCFDEATAEEIADSAAPEDLKFAIDWVKAGGVLAECPMMVEKSCGNWNLSSIFDDNEHRRQRYQEHVKKWSVSYLRSLYPRGPRAWSILGFKNHRCPEVKLTFPRSRVYTLEAGDLPGNKLTK